MARIFYLDDKLLNVESVLSQFTKLNLNRGCGQENLDVTASKFNGDDTNHSIKAISSKYDAVILEYDLGDGKTGVDIARELRREGYNKPIIIFSNSHDSYSIEKNPDIEDLDLRFVDKMDGFESLYKVVQAAISLRNEAKITTIFH